jgi:hypothetical protein
VLRESTLLARWERPLMVSLIEGQLLRVGSRVR